MSLKILPAIALMSLAPGLVAQAALAPTPGEAPCPPKMAARLSHDRGSLLLVCRTIPNLVTPGGKKQVFVIQNVRKGGGQEEGEGGITVSIYNGESDALPFYRQSGFGLGLLPLENGGSPVPFAIVNLGGTGHLAWVIRTVSQPTSLVYIKSFDPAKKGFESLAGTDPVVSDFADKVEISGQSVRVLHAQSPPREYRYENGELVSVTTER